MPNNRSDVSVVELGVNDEQDRSNKVLYVCRANMGRSQVAAALHNHYRPGFAESAGTQISEIQAHRLEDWRGADTVVKAMEARGLDISQNTRRQLERREALSFGHVVVMAELNTRPLYLLGFETAEVWDVVDLKDKNLAEANTIIDDIDSRVKKLVLRLGEQAIRRPHPLVS